MALGARYLNRLPSELVDLFAELEMDIINDIAKRIAKADYSITTTAEWQNYKLKQLGYSQIEINRLIAKKLNISSQKVKKIMLEATRYGYDSDSIIYKRAKKQGANLGTLIDFEDMPKLQMILEAGIKQTQWELENYTRSMGLTISANFTKALDKAWLQVQSGAFTQQQATRQAIISLARDGVGVVEYASGHVDRVDVAVRRAVITGCNKTNAEISLKRMQYMEVDLVITTSHNGARPTHATWQGKVFSYSGATQGYEDFRSATGYGTVTGLCGANCRHSFYPYMEGVSENTMLEFDKNENNELYEAEQEQRRLERNIRAWKRREQALESAGQDSSFERAKVKEWQKRQREHIDRFGLQRQYDREIIY